MGIVLLSFQINSPLLSVHAEHVEPNTQWPWQQIESLAQPLQYLLSCSEELQTYPVSVHLSADPDPEHTHNVVFIWHSFEQVKWRQVHVLTFLIRINKVNVSKQIRLSDESHDHWQ